MQRVVVEGNIGCGKSTFLKGMVKLPHVTVKLEPIHKWQNLGGHNLLHLMYEDPQRWTMTFQTYAQVTMFKQMTMWPDDPNCKVSVQERSIWAARYVFVENALQNGFLHPADIAVLNELYEYHQSLGLLNVNHIIYLRCDPEVCFQRMRTRGRSEEQGLPLSYLIHIHQLYDEWLVNGKHPTHGAKVHVVDGMKSQTEMDIIAARLVESFQ